MDNPPIIAGYFEEDGSSYQSLQPPQEFSSGSLLPSETPIEEGTTLPAHTYACSECSTTFTKKYLLNKHSKKHYPPFKCKTNSCTRSFEHRRDFERHQSARHPEVVLVRSMWSCPYDGCRFSVQQNGGSSRRDNVVRHISSQHGVEMNYQDDFMEE